MVVVAFYALVRIKAKAPQEKLIGMDTVDNIPYCRDNNGNKIPLRYNTQKKVWVKDNTISF
jgi:hypothetical protein